LGGGGTIDHPLNLLSAGWAFGCGCHYSQHLKGIPSQQLLKRRVAWRERVTVEAIEQFILAVRHLPRDASQEQLAAALPAGWRRTC
jgi:hypothetical protein